MNSNLSYHARKKSWQKRLMVVFFTTIFLVWFQLYLGPQAFAATLTPDEAVAALELTFYGKVNEFYKMFTQVVRPIAVVLLAYYAIGCLLGTQKEIEKNLGKIKFLALALAATWLLPAIVNGVLGFAGGAGTGLPMTGPTSPPTPTPT